MTDANKDDNKDNIKKKQKGILKNQNEGTTSHS